MTGAGVTLRDVYLARQRIGHVARRTPLLQSPVLSERSGASVFLKAENLQETGTFKIRGAANRMATLTQEQKARGVITVSSGNHGRAVSFVAARLGIRAVICLSTRVPANKVSAIRALGAEVVVQGDSYDEAEVHSLHLQREQGLTRIDPFDDPYVIAGQGTVGLELLEDLPDIDACLVPLSGGGLISGIALALKSASPAIRIIGVSMERAPVMAASLRAGKPVVLPEEDTLADALAGGIGVNNQYTFRMAQQYVDDTVLVTEEDIAVAMAFLLEEHHLIAEGAGAVSVAALLSEKAHGLGRRVCAVVSGGNVDVRVVLQLARDRLGPAS